MLKLGSFPLFPSNPYLNGNCLSNSSKDTQRQFGLVTTVSPKSVSTARNAETTKQKQKERYIAKQDELAC